MSSKDAMLLHAVGERDTSALENGETTFQVQFEWPLCTNYPHTTSVIPDSTHKRAPARWAKYLDNEDNFLIQFKEEEKLGWAEIRRLFAGRFPERASSSLQVHYWRELKDPHDGLGRAVMRWMRDVT